ERHESVARSGRANWRGSRPAEQHHMDAGRIATAELIEQVSLSCSVFEVPRDVDIRSCMNGPCSGQRQPSIIALKSTEQLAAAIRKAPGRVIAADLPRPDLASLFAGPDERNNESRIAWLRRVLDGRNEDMLDVVSPDVCPTFV